MHPRISKTSKHECGEKINYFNALIHTEPDILSFFERFSFLITSAFPLHSSFSILLLKLQFSRSTSKSVLLYFRNWQIDDHVSGEISLVPAKLSLVIRSILFLNNC